ncbi:MULTISPECIES: hypothetical protein [unclassified Cupriavidus]|uniref:hypothetical protein n=1 Tax=unclassified Cupriavidus TaxID=2640874 RepID=UPI001CEDB62D|nr:MULTISPECIES: hypothetical protein [unclassified Cupriavidus]
MFDLLMAPVLMLVSVLASLLVVAPAYAQLSGAAQADYSYQRTMSRVVAGSASGLQMNSNSTMDILNGGRRIGTIALKEKRLMDVAALAARAVSLPAMATIGASLLINYGLEKCLDGTWCKRSGQPGSSTNLKCADLARDQSTYGYFTYSGNKLWGWYTATGKPPGQITPPAGYNGSTLTADGICNPAAAGYYIFFFPQTVQNPPPADLVPATAADILEAWKNGLKGNPYVQEQVYGFEDQTQKNQEWADALAQTAELIGSGTVTDVGPETSTTADGKTTKKQTTCTYTATPNSDTSSSKESPLSVARTCTTTTTNPDGTKTQETTTESGAPAKGQEPAKVEVETCGLPNKPACKIDETGTRTQSDVDTELQQRSADMDSRLSGVQQAANDTLSTVDQKHDSVHIFSLFNVFPTFASETCENPQIPGVAGGMLPVDICTYYYLLKDVMAFGVALYVLVDSVQVVREAVKV